MKEKFLNMEHINKQYFGVHALTDVNFDLIRGEIHCLVGQNGCGKSTLIKIISGVLKAESGGTIRILNEKIGNGSAKRVRDLGVRVIYQDLSLFPNLTVAENIAIHNHVEKGKGPVNWKKIKEEAQAALDKIQVALPLDSPVEKLTIAQRQLVAIARVLATNGQLIIMDEPTSSLTRKEVNNLFRIMKELQKAGITILFVSHKLDEIIEIADRITIIRDGVNQGTYLNHEISQEKLSYLISGRTITLEQQFSEPESDIVLEVKGLSLSNQYEDISFHLKKGEILGIIGLLGSGRTELALSLFGMNPQKEGIIKVNGKNVVLKHNWDAIKNGIAYVPEDRLLQGLIIEQSVQDNMVVTIYKQLQNRFGLLNNKAKTTIAQKWINRLEIKSAAPKIPAASMSGGNQQKIVISKWLATNPKVLILDQPTNGIDVAAKQSIYEIIRKLAKDGMSIILISDEVPEIYYNCSRALLMHKGRIQKEIETGLVSEEEFYEEVLYV